MTSILGNTCNGDKCCGLIHFVTNQDHNHSPTLTKRSESHKHSHKKKEISAYLPAVDVVRKLMKYVFFQKLLNSSILGFCSYKEIITLMICCFCKFVNVNEIFRRPLFHTAESQLRPKSAETCLQQNQTEHETMQS